jgi:hypothetical protein
VMKILHRCLSVLEKKNKNKKHVQKEVIKTLHTISKSVMFYGVTRWIFSGSVCLGRFSVPQPWLMGPKPFQISKKHPKRCIAVMPYTHTVSDILHTHSFIYTWSSHGSLHP